MTTTNDLVKYINCIAIVPDGLTILGFHKTLPSLPQLSSFSYNHHSQYTVLNTI